MSWFRNLVRSNEGLSFFDDSFKRLIKSKNDKRIDWYAKNEPEKLEKMMDENKEGKLFINGGNSGDYGITDVAKAVLSSSETGKLSGMRIAGTAVGGGVGIAGMHKMFSSD